MTVPVAVINIPEPLTAVGMLGLWAASRLIYDAEAASVDIATAAVIAGFNIAIAGAYTALAKDYYDLYKDQKEFYYNNFQTGGTGEAALASQVFNSPLIQNGQAGVDYVQQYAAQLSNVLAFEASGGFSTEWLPIHNNMYGVTVNYDQLIAVDQEAVVADNATYLYQYEDLRRDVYNERTWEWQNQSLNYGVKQGNIVESGLATSYHYLDESMGNLSDFFATQSNGLAASSGYRSSFNSTRDSLASSLARGSGLAMSQNLGQRKQPRYDVASGRLNTEWEGQYGQ